MLVSILVLVNNVAVNQHVQNVQEVNLLQLIRKNVLTNVLLILVLIQFNVMILITNVIVLLLQQIIVQLKQMNLVFRYKQALVSIYLTVSNVPQINNV